MAHRLLVAILLSTLPYVLFSSILVFGDYRVHLSKRTILGLTLCTYLLGTALPIWYLSTHCWYDPSDTALQALTLMLVPPLIAYQAKRHGVRPEKRLALGLGYLTAAGAAAWLFVYNYLPH